MVYKNNSWYITADFIMVITVWNFNVETQFTNKIWSQDIFMGSQLCQEWMYFQSFGNSCSASSRMGVVQLYWVSRKLLYKLFIYLIHYIRILWFLHDLSTPCSNEHVTKPQASVQGHVFSFVVVCCGILTVAVLAVIPLRRVWVHKKTAWVRWWIRWWWLQQ